RSGFVGGLDFKDVICEIADFVKRVPCGHLYGHGIRDRRNCHRDMEKMLFRMRQRNLIPNCCEGRRSCRKKEGKEKKDADGQPERFHFRAASGTSSTAAASLSTSFWHSPSKLPFDMMRKRSPVFPLDARCSAMGSAPARTSASTPSFRTSAATDSGSSRLSSPS